MRKLFLGCLFLIACERDEIIPTCDFVSVIRNGKASITINSNEPLMSFYPANDPMRITYLSDHYYQCISIEAVSGEVYIFNSGGKECEIIIP